MGRDDLRVVRGCLPADATSAPFDRGPDGAGPSLEMPPGGTTFVSSVVASPFRRDQRTLRPRTRRSWSLPGNAPRRDDLRVVRGCLPADRTNAPSDPADQTELVPPGKCLQFTAGSPKARPHPSIRCIVGAGRDHARPQVMSGAEPDPQSSLLRQGFFSAQPNRSRSLYSFSFSLSPAAC